MAEIKKILTIIIIIFGVSFPLYSQKAKAAAKTKVNPMPKADKQEQKEKVKPVIDTAAAKIYNDGKNNFATSGVKFTLYAEDKLSAINSIMYKINDAAEYSKYNEPIMFPKEGTYIISYFSSDNVENKSGDDKFTVIIDNTGPEVKLDPGIKLVSRDNKNFAPGSAEFTLSASDSGCGVKNIQISLDDGNYAVYTKAIKFDKGGPHTIKYKAADNLGNSSSEEVFSVIIDNAKPVIKIIPSGKLFEMKDMKFAPADYTYAVEVESKESGIAKVMTAVDDQDFTDYKTPIKFSAEGKHTIKAKAVDSVGNESDTALLIVNMDATPPEVKLVPVEK